MIDDSKDCPSEPLPLLVDAKTLARLLSVSVATIHRMDEAGKLPEPIRLSGGCTRGAARLFKPGLRPDVPTAGLLRPRTAKTFRPDWFCSFGVLEFPYLCWPRGVRDCNPAPRGRRVAERPPIWQVFIAPWSFNTLTRKAGVFPKTPPERSESGSSRRHGGRSSRTPKATRTGFPRFRPGNR